MGLSLCLSRQCCVLSKRQSENSVLTEEARGHLIQQL